MSDPREHESFDLLVEKSGRGFRAVVISSPAGEGKADFKPPYSDEKLQETLARLAAVPHRDLLAAHSAESPCETAEAIGKRLFNALFPGEVGALWRESRARVEAQGKGLRLRIRFQDEAARFESWPWELLFDPNRRRFVAQSVRTPLVRYLTLPVTPELPPAAPPLRMLVVAARPSGYPPLDEEREWSRLQHALSGWVERGWLVLERLDRATLEDLQQDLQKPCHILHIVSHGRFDATRREGALVLEDKEGRPQTVTGVRLGAILAAQSELRLVVLNACEGALTSVTDPLAGMAQTLAGSRTPAVVAMRSRISDEAAVVFAQRFYEALGRNFPVDVALAEARRAMLSRKDDLEWTAPVLYTRSSRLFYFPEPKKKARVPRPAWVAAVALSIVGALVGSFYPFMNKAAPKAERADPNLTYVAENPPECPSPPDLRMAFVKVPPGSLFTSDTQPFCIGRFEVTQAQWKKIMGNNPSDHKGNTLPVERVLWEEVQEFLTRLNARVPGANFRLPTNAQWEYAAGAGTAGPYSFKGDPEDLSRYGNCVGNRGSTIQVGSLAPNPWGIFDMYGNVAELVADEPSNSPAGAPPGKHVRRGGGFRSASGSCDSVNRSLIQSRHNSDTGFRIVRNLQR